jgi:hypothetical protein
MSDSLARLRAAVEQMQRPFMNESWTRGWQDAISDVLALLDAEAGEPEPYDPPEDWRETPNRDGSLAPPPSDARERLALALNHLAFPCSAGTPQEAADAILAAHREELEPLAERETPIRAAKESTVNLLYWMLLLIGTVWFLTLSYGHGKIMKQLDRLMPDTVQVVEAPDAD